MKKLSPGIKIQGTQYSVSDFWSWGFSDILMNSLRGVYSEFLVGSALGVLQEPRVEWNTHDLMYIGKKIEVKSAAYIQTWHKGKYSKIKFSIEAKKSYNYDTNRYSTNAIRYADIYVFCLLKEKDKNQIDALNMEHWDFFVVPTQILNNLYPTQKSISLSVLEKNSRSVSYEEIKEVIDAVISGEN